VSIDNWPNQCNSCGRNYYAEIRHDSGYCSDACELADPVRDALDLVRRAHTNYTSATTLAGETRVALRLALKQAREQGVTLAEIGKQVGVSRQRVHQLTSEVAP
jgi:DNA-directed RNA polymerase specialized sigma subunit